MSPNSRKVLVFSTTYLPYIGGAELALKEVMERLSDIQFDVITSKPNKSLPKEEVFGNIKVHRVGNPWFLKDILLPKNFYPLSAFFKAVTLSRKNKYNAIFALQASQGAGAAWLYKWFSGIPFILNIQEGKDLKKQGFLINFFRNLIIRKANVVTVISSYLQGYVGKINPKAKLFVIPNGVDLSKFKYQERLIGEAKKIITVSRLVPKNGVEDLVSAFHILGQKKLMYDASLLIVGKGPLEESLKLKAKSLKLEDKIEFFGEVPNDNLPEYLVHADIFVRPSLSEGLGTAFLEAMAIGLPIVGTSIGGITDFLKDRETGLICEPNNPNDLADKMALLLDDAALRESMTRKARKLVEEKYDWNIIAKQYEKIINNCSGI